MYNDKVWVNYNKQQINASLVTLLSAKWKLFQRLIVGKNPKTKGLCCIS